MLKSLLKDERSFLFFLGADSDYPERRARRNFFPGKKAMKLKHDIRPSPIAGQWYPADPLRLAAQVDSQIQSARLPEIQGEVVAVIAPHAGHLYSGPVAGYAFATLRGLAPELVAVVAPMHHYYSQPLLTTAHEAYATPLGEIVVDRDAVNTLTESLKNELGFGLTPVARDPEHSLEIELPFLQRSLKPPFQLLPIMIRDQSSRTAQRLGEALADVLKDRKAILVASSDLSHFYPQGIAEKLDSAFLQQVAAFDPDGVIQIEQEGRGFACGRGAVASVLWAAKSLGANQVQVLHYATSGDVTGDYEGVVGYGAAVVTRPASQPSSNEGL
jgi:AmmeMemoRadiSam system protein B